MTTGFFVLSRRATVFSYSSGQVRRPSSGSASAPRISQQDFKKLLAAKNVVVVDTRNPGEFQLGHIAGALLLPLEGQLTWPAEYESVVTQLIATKKPVVAYCA